MDKSIQIITMLIGIIGGSCCILASIIEYKKTKDKSLITMIVGALLIIISLLLGQYNGFLYRSAQITKQQTGKFLLINGLISLIGIILVLRVLLSKKKKSQ